MNEYIYFFFIYIYFFSLAFLEKKEGLFGQKRFPTPALDYALSSKSAI